MRHFFTAILLSLILPMTLIAHTHDDEEIISSATSSDTIGTSTEETATSSTPTIIEDTFQAELDAHRAAFKTKTQERIYNLTQNIQGRLRAATERLLNITDRMDARATILVQSGKDSSAARPYIENARHSLEQAQGLMADDLGRFAYSEDPRAEFPNVRARVHMIGQHLRDARQSLTDALTALKQADEKSSLTDETSSSTKPEVQ